MSAVRKPSDSEAPSALCLHLAELPGLHHFPFSCFLPCDAHCWAMQTDECGLCPHKHAAAASNWSSCLACLLMLS